MACDGCRGLGVPLCLEYCTKKEDLKKILGEFSEKVTRVEGVNARDVSGFTRRS